jgi:hypothetical protein
VQADPLAEPGTPDGGFDFDEDAEELEDTELPDDPAAVLAMQQGLELPPTLPPPVVLPEDAPLAIGADVRLAEPMQLSTGGFPSPGGIADWGLRLISTVNDVHPPRAIVGLPDGTEEVAGTLGGTEVTLEHAAFHSFDFVSSGETIERTTLLVSNIPDVCGLAQVELSSCQAICDGWSPFLQGVDADVAWLGRADLVDSSYTAFTAVETFEWFGGEFRMNFTPIDTADFASPEGCLTACADRLANPVDPVEVSSGLVAVQERSASMFTADFRATIGTDDLGGRVEALPCDLE